MSSTAAHMVGLRGLPGALRGTLEGRPHHSDSRIAEIFDRQLLRSTPTYVRLCAPARRSVPAVVKPVDTRPSAGISPAPHVIWNYPGQLDSWGSERIALTPPWGGYLASRRNLRAA